jgi:hypothetical protein
MAVIALAILLVFLFVVVMIASLVGLLFWGITAAALSDLDSQHRSRILTASVLPFFCWGLIAAPVLLQWLVFEKRNLPGSNNLLNDYKIMMIDEKSSAWIYDSRNEFNKGSISWKKDAVEGVKTLQISGSFILGGCGNNGFSDSEKKRARIENYFIVDTKAHKTTQFSSFLQFREAALALGIGLDMEDPYDVYQRHNFASVPGAVKLILLVVLVGLLIRWRVNLQRLRNGTLRVAY